MAAKAGVTGRAQVVKFSPDGKVLMRLGEAGVAGNDESHFASPSAVAVAANGDIFVADGHEDGNNRVVKFSKEGKFIKAWGKTGYAPGEFRSMHALAIDMRGRVFVADRANNRIQLFDQEGKFLADLDAVRHAERHLLRRSRTRSTSPIPSRTRSTTPGGAGHPYRRRPNRLGEVFHPRSGRQPERADRERPRVRDRR